MILKRLFAASLIWMLLSVPIAAQDAPAYALDNMIIHNSDGSVTDSGTLVWRDGVIESVGSNVEIPYDAYVIDGGDSLHVYPGFIDGLGMWGMPDPESPERVDDPGNPGYDRAGVQPHRSASDHLDTESEELESAMKAGILTANIGLKGYMLPGQPDIFFLNGEQTEDHLFMESTGYQFAFEEAPGGWSNRAFPSTLMGVMAQFRQLMYDAVALQDHLRYFAAAEGAIQAPQRNKVLESLFPVMSGEKKLMAVVDSPENLERLLKLKNEFGFVTTLVSGKELYRHAETLAEMDIPVLASIELPEKPGWMKESDEDEESNTEEEVSEEEEAFRERQRQAWEAMAQNIRTLMDADVKVGFSSSGLAAGELHEAARNLTEMGGLTEEEVLQIMTSNTAEILGRSAAIGSLRAGSIASFSVFDAPFFDEEASVHMAISNGVIHELD
jgi:imidazolonepropionase-like amidohydrolase